MNPAHKINQIQAELEVCESEKGRKVLERKLREIQVSSVRQSLPEEIRLAVLDRIAALEQTRSMLESQEPKDDGKLIATEMQIKDEWRLKARLDAGEDFEACECNATEAEACGYCKEARENDEIPF